jgi:hypothetical protein
MFQSSTVPPPSHPYQRLRDFIGSWFHRDVDLEADPSVESITTTFRTVTSEQERSALKAEIELFLKQPGDLNEEFNRYLEPDVDPRGWGLNARQWLETVHSLL